MKVTNFRFFLGTDVVRRRRPGDPPSPNGLIVAFEALASRGTRVSMYETVVRKFQPYLSFQRNIDFDMYVTDEKDVKFCDDAEVSLLRNWEIELPELPENEDFDQEIEDTTIIFTLTFGTVEILATAQDQRTGKKYKVTFLDPK